MCICWFYTSKDCGLGQHSWGNVGLPCFMFVYLMIKNSESTFCHIFIKLKGAHMITLVFHWLQINRLHSMGTFKGIVLSCYNIRICIAATERFKKVSGTQTVVKVQIVHIQQFTRLFFESLVWNWRLQIVSDLHHMSDWRKTMVHTEKQF